MGDIQIVCKGKVVANVQHYQAKPSDWFGGSWNLIINNVYPLDDVVDTDDFLAGREEFTLVIRKHDRTIEYGCGRVSAYVEPERGCYPKLWANAFQRTEAVR